MTRVHSEPEELVVRTRKPFSGDCAACACVVRGGLAIFSRWHPQPQTDRGGMGGVNTDVEG